MKWFCSKVCDYLKAGCDKKKIRIDIVGWSRGAIMAMHIAGKLSSSECKCGKDDVKVEGYKVRFVGLIDPVDTALNEDLEMISMRGDTQASFNDVSNALSRNYTLPRNVQSAFIAYAGKRSLLGRVVFDADFVLLQLGTQFLGSATSYDVDHEHIGATWVENDGTINDGGVGADLDKAFGSVIR